MQHRILSSLILLGISLLIIQPKAKAGNPEKLSFENRSFIENKGQFDGRIGKYSDKIEYAVDFGALQIYFTQEGVYYAMYQTPKNYKRKKGQKGVPRMLVKSDMLQILFMNKSEDVKIVASEMTPDYHTYPLKKMDGSFEDVNFIRGFKKLTYSNLYPGIDLEYVFDKRGGLKYSFKIKAGSNPNKIKFQFSGNRLLQLDSDGNLQVETPFGNITDHKPLSYYTDNSNQIIESSFLLKDNQLSFQLGNYDLNREIIIDPWTVTPNSFSNSNKVFEIETDQNSNIYVYGGDSPFRLKKYDSGGNLQWTYNTPWDTSGYWVGTLKTDLVGNSYITSGTSGTLRKINTGGTMDWTNANTGPIPEIEFWSLSFNCDYSKLFCGGMRSDNGINIAGYRGTIFDMSLVNGAVTAFKNVGFNTGGLIPTIKEVRSISYSPNGNIYYLTLDSIGCLNPSFIQTFQNSSAFNFTYGIPDYGVTNQGIHAIAAGTNFIYTNNGNTVQKRSIANGAVITSVTIPGGISTTVPFIGGNTPGNSGIVLDSCGNVYVGSGNGVYKYDANLNQTGSFTTPAAVYDVAINYNGEIVACGNNFIVSIANFSPCFPPAPVCLNCLELTPAGPFCVTNPAITLTANNAGGTWSGAGITNGITGAFNPALAGVGTHVIHYTLANPLPCGLDSMTITVNPCNTITVCQDSTGALTALNATAPYNWQSSSTTQDCSACLIGCIFPPGCAVNATTWTTYSTSQTAMPPTGVLPIRLIDGNGDTLVITTLAGIPPCSNCPTININIDSQTNITCNGSNNGSATVSASGGTGPYSYLWSPGNLSGPSQNNLSPANYTIIATDSAGCTGQLSINFTEPSALSSSVTTQPASCNQSDGSGTVSISGGTPGYSFSWAPSGGNDSTASGLAAGSYTVTVTDNAGCTLDVPVSISNLGAPQIQIVSQTNPTCFGATDGSAQISASLGTSPYTYSWSPSGGNSASANNLGAGIYTITVTGADNCQASEIITLTEPVAILLTSGSTPADCGQTNGNAFVTASLGVSPYTYLWQPGAANTASITSVASGNYVVTVTDANNCSQIDTVNIGVVVTDSSLTAVITTLPETCTGFDGSAIAIASGGLPPYQYSWNGAAFTDSASVFGLASGTYTLTVYDQCYSEVFAFTIDQTLSAPDSSLYNILTPNDDGKNDFYDAGLQFEGTENFECIIYNRWGNIMHKTDNPAILWIPNSGVSPGVYFMVVLYTDCLGNSVKLTGTVTVARN